MQLFALDDDKRLVFANHAIRQTDYRCCECQGIIRLRKGLHRQPHFFHLQPANHCHLSGKGMVHLQVQMHLFQLFPEGECFLEHRFPSIQRIADVVWIPKKLVFEIQCSPISAEEVEQRNADYRKEGWQVIWILHDNRYNHHRLSAAEFLLRTTSHYFTNIDQSGQGIIYDQLSIVQRGIRKHTFRSLTINIAAPQAISDEHKRDRHPITIQERTKTWPTFFQGDHLDTFFNTSNPQEFLDFDRLAVPSEPPQTSLFSLFTRLLVKPYHLLFQLFLEKTCR